jgi:hypothetical protein
MVGMEVPGTIPVESLDAVYSFPGECFHRAPQSSSSEETTSKAFLTPIFSIMSPAQKARQTKLYFETTPLRRMFVNVVPGRGECSYQGRKAALMQALTSRTKVLKEAERLLFKNTDIFNVPHGGCSKL